MLELPKDTIYTLAILGPSIRKADTLGWHGKNCLPRPSSSTEWLNAFGSFSQTIIALLENFAIQSFFLYMLWDLSVKSIQQQVDCPNTDPLLRWACLCVFTAGTLSDIAQSMNMGIWLYLLPTATQHMAVGYQIVDRQRVLDARWGLTRLQKTFAWLCVLVPKFAIAGFMFVIGTAFLSISSSNDVLIVNTVALNYILEIDELLFKVFVPDFVKNCVMNLPPIDLRRSNEPVRSPVKRLQESIKHLSRSSRSMLMSSSRQQNVLSTAASGSFAGQSGRCRRRRSSIQRVWLQRSRKQNILAYMQLRQTLSEIGVSNLISVLFVALVATLADRVLCLWTSWKNVDTHS